MKNNTIKQYLAHDHRTMHDVVLRGNDMTVGLMKNHYDPVWGRKYLFALDFIERRTAEIECDMMRCYDDNNKEKYNDLDGEKKSIAIAAKQIHINFRVKTGFNLYTYSAGDTITASCMEMV